MIKILRVDDAFIHGRIALLWSRKLNLDDIIIINDQLVFDDFMKMTLELATPRNVSLLFLNFENANKTVNEEIKKGKNIMIVVNKLSDALKVCEMYDDIKSVNIGGLKQRPYSDSKQIVGSVFISKEDYCICSKLIKMGIEVEIRKVPDETRIIIK